MQLRDVRRARRPAPLQHLGDRQARRPLADRRRGQQAQNARPGPAHRRLAQVEGERVAGAGQRQEELQRVERRQRGGEPRHVLPVARRRRQDVVRKRRLEVAAPQQRRHLLDPAVARQLDDVLAPVVEPPGVNHRQARLQHRQSPVQRVARRLGRIAPVLPALLQQPHVLGRVAPPPRARVRFRADQPRLT